MESSCRGAIGPTHRGNSEMSDPLRRVRRGSPIVISRLVRETRGMNGRSGRFRLWHRRCSSATPGVCDMWKLVVAVAFGIVLAAAPASAQDEKPVDINIGFGWLFPEGNFANSFDAGWNGTFAATFNISPTLGVQGE